MFPRVFGVLLLLIGALPAAERPNILLIVSDDQGYPDLSCIGTKPVQTPHLDRLAAAIRSAPVAEFQTAYDPQQAAGKQ